MDNFNVEEFKQTVLLYHAAGVSADKVKTIFGGDDYRDMLKTITEYFNREDNVWYENLKMTVVDIGGNSWGIRIYDKHSNQGIGYGIYNFASNIVYSNPLYTGLFNINDSFYYGYSLDKLCFVYIKCKNGYVCGLVGDFNDCGQLLRFCGFTGESESGKEQVSILQNSCDYYLSTEKYGCEKLEASVPVACSGDKTILTPLYVPNKNLFAPDVYWCEGNMVNTGKLYELNGGIYVNCMYHGRSLNYDTCKIAFRVC